jgi:NhaP-type Na+/H+ or K+/H+ antiporter
VSEALLEQLVVVLVLAVACTWLARVIAVPAILPLLAAGILAGPVTGFLRPDEFLGEALFPAISVAVAVLLLEGGMSLRLRDLREVGRPVLLLISVGVGLTFALAAAFLRLSGGLSHEIALIVASLLVVSGPTVVGPLLAGAQPSHGARRTLIWEGIAIDPIGATLALSTLNAVTRHGNPVTDLLFTASIGIASGLLGAGVYVLAARRRWLPPELEVHGVLLLALCVFAAAERIEPEAGLFAATAMGLALANQRLVRITHIHEFHREVAVLIIGVLFVILGARIDLRALGQALPITLPLLAFLILVVRPLATWVCTARSHLSGRERAFIALVAPRGIIAAATASLFAMKLESQGHAPGPMVAMVLVIVMASCLVYGLSATPLATLLGIRRARSKAVVLVGTADWLVRFAASLGGAGAEVKLVTLGRPLASASPGGIAVFTAPLAERTPGHQADDAAQVLLAADEPDLNLLAAWHYGARLGYDRLVLLAPARPLPADSTLGELETIGPAAFSGRLSAGDLADGAFRVLQPPPEGPRDEDGVLLARVSGDGTVNLCPRRHRFKRGERAVLLTNGCSGG